MKFTELSEKGKEKAVKDYIQGWKETHPDRSLSIKVATECCIDSNDDVDLEEVEE